MKAGGVVLYYAEGVPDYFTVYLKYKLQYIPTVYTEPHYRTSKDWIGGKMFIGIPAGDLEVEYVEVWTSFDTPIRCEIVDRYWNVKKSCMVSSSEHCIYSELSQPTTVTVSPLPGAYTPSAQQASQQGLLPTTTVVVQEQVVTETLPSKEANNTVVVGTGSESQIYVETKPVETKPYATPEELMYVPFYQLYPEEAEKYYPAPTPYKPVYEVKPEEEAKPTIDWSKIALLGLIIGGIYLLERKK